MSGLLARGKCFVSTKLSAGGTAASRSEERDLLTKLGVFVGLSKCTQARDLKNVCVSLSLFY